jgi:hypothetical protein
VALLIMVGKEDTTLKPKHLGQLLKKKMKQTQFYVVMKGKDSS